MRVKARSFFGFHTILGFRRYRCSRCKNRLFLFQKYCGKCGAELEWEFERCSRCKKVLSIEDEEYCTECGQRL